MISRHDDDPYESWDRRKADNQFAWFVVVIVLFVLACIVSIGECWFTLLALFCGFTMLRLAYKAMYWPYFFKE